MNHDGRGFINLTPWSLVQLEPRFFRFSTQPEARIALELEDVFQVANKLIDAKKIRQGSMCLKHPEQVHKHPALLVSPLTM